MAALLALDGSTAAGGRSPSELAAQPKGDHHIDDSDRVEGEPHDDRGRPRKADQRWQDGADDRNDRRTDQDRRHHGRRHRLRRLVTGVALAEVGHQVTCVDVDAARVTAINQGEAPIFEVGLQDLLRRNLGVRFTATTDLQRAVSASDVTFLCVGTPPRRDGGIELAHVIRATEQVGTVLAGKRAFHSLVVKSTVVPGTTDEVVLPELERASGKRAGRDFGVGMNPEFLTEGVAVDDFLKPDRIVLGGMDERSIDKQREIYASFVATPVLTTNNKTAEMIKYASNSVLATMISFSNEIGNLCAALGGIDVADVMRGVHAARYFTVALDGERRVRAPISSFLWAGCGYGGSCLPKDTKALSAHAVAHGASMPLLDAVIDTNLAQPGKMLAVLEKHFPSLAGLERDVHRLRRITLQGAGDLVLARRQGQAERRATLRLAVDRHVGVAALRRDIVSRAAHPSRRTPPLAP